MRKSRLFLSIYLCGLIINSVPILFNYYYSQDSARLLFVPYIYIPGLIFLALLSIENLYIRKDYFLLLVLYMLVSSVSTFFIGVFTIGTFIYWISFPSVIILYNCCRSYFKENIGFNYIFLRSFVLLMFIICCIGLFAYFLYYGIPSNTGWHRFNPFSTANLNGSSILITYALYLTMSANVNYKPIFKSKYIKTFLIIFFSFCIILSNSRTSFLMLLAILFYESFRSISNNKNYFYKLWSQRKSFLILGSSFIIIPFLIFNTETGRRMMRIISIIFNNQIFELTLGIDGDYQRVLYASKAIQLFLANPFLGTGSGLINYQNSSYILFNESFSKAHNFYLSYLAENGIIGFSFISIILLIVFMDLVKTKNTGFAILVALSLFFNEYIYQPELWLISSMLASTNNLLPNTLKIKSITNDFSKGNSSQT